MAITRCAVVDSCGEVFAATGPDAYDAAIDVLAFVEADPYHEGAVWLETTVPAG